MTNMMPLHEKGEKVCVVLKMWREPEGRLTTYFMGNSKMEFVKVFQLVSTGNVHGSEDKYTDYTDVKGNKWIGMSGSNGLQFFPAEVENIEYLIGDQVVADDARAELVKGPLLRLKTVEAEIGELSQAIILQGIIRDYHEGRVSWEDADSFVPSFSGIGKKSVDIQRDDFLASFDVSQKMFTDLFAELKKQVTEVTGLNFDESFVVGGTLFTQRQRNTVTGQEPHHHVLLSHGSCTAVSDKDFKVHKTVAEVVDAFMTAIGGPINFKRKMYGEETPVIFSYGDYKVTARYTEYTNLDGAHTQKFVALTSSILDLPVYLYF